MVLNHSNIDIKNLNHVVGFFCHYLISISTTLAIWYILKFISKVYIRTITTFLIAFISYWIIINILDYLTFNKTIEEFITYRLFNNISITIIIHVQTSCYTIAFLHLRRTIKKRTNLETIQKEKESLNLKVLQENLEPHFLFNNLNVLAQLAKEEPEKVDDFIDDFSDVYRYYLKFEKEKLVTIDKEIDFIKKYINLICKQYTNRYILDINIIKRDIVLVPCTLQLCIEKIIKNNIATTQSPLEIKITNNDNYIFIRNKLSTLNKKNDDDLGYSYLKKQYKLNFDKKIITTKTDKENIIKIPLIDTL